MLPVGLEPRPLANRALDAILEPGTALVLAWIAAVGLVVHSDPLLATLVALGAGGAFFAGLLGVGGAIVLIPLLVYVPPALGTGHLSMHDIAAVTMVQVFVAAAAGMAGHLRDGFVDRRLVLDLGSGMMVGSLAGAIGSRWISAAALQGVFAAMAAAAAAMMIAFGRREPGSAAGGAQRGRLPGFLIALGVGLLAGAVGAGGAFLLIPLMLYVLHIPVRVAVGTSLAIVFLAAAAGVAGKAITHQVPGWPALALVAGALPAAQLGSATSRRLHTKQLRFVLALTIVVIAVKMWWDILR